MYAYECVHHIHLCVGNDGCWLLPRSVQDHSQQVVSMNYYAFPPDPPDPPDPTRHARPARPARTDPPDPPDPTRPDAPDPTRRTRPARPARPDPTRPTRPTRPARPDPADPTRPARPARPDPTRPTPLGRTFFTELSSCLLRIQTHICMHMNVYIIYISALGMAVVGCFPDRCMITRNRLCP